MYHEEEDNKIDRENTKKTNPSASRASSYKQYSKSKCHRCNGVAGRDHWKNECPWKENKWFCYTCNGEANHNGTNCPYNTEKRLTGFKRALERGGHSEFQAKRGRGSYSKG